MIAIKVEVLLPEGYIGFWSYGDVLTFRVDFLTQNILDRVQI